MNALVPVFTIDELVHRAGVLQDGIGKIAYAHFMNVAKAETIVAEAVVDAVDDWEFEHGPANPLLPAMLTVAVLRVVQAGWDAREKRFEDALREEEIDGARRYLGD